MDFVHDAAESGRKFRVIDAYTRECLALEVDTGFPGPRMTRVLETLVAERGAPEAMRCDKRAGVHVAEFSSMGAGEEDRGGPY